MQFDWSRERAQRAARPQRVSLHSKGRLHLIRVAKGAHGGQRRGIDRHAGRVRCVCQLGRRGGRDRLPLEHGRRVEHGEARRCGGVEGDELAVQVSARGHDTATRREQHRLCMPERRHDPLAQQLAIERLGHDKVDSPPAQNVRRELIGAQREDLHACSQSIALDHALAHCGNRRVHLAADDERARAGRDHAKQAKAGANIKNERRRAAPREVRAHRLLDGRGICRIAWPVLEHRRHHAVLASDHGALSCLRPRQATAAVHVDATRLEHALGDSVTRRRIFLVVRREHEAVVDRRVGKEVGELAHNGVSASDVAHERIPQSAMGLKDKFLGSAE